MSMLRILVFLFYCSTHALLAQNSVLSAGAWFKIGITETGIYKLDKNTLDAMGVPASVDPAKIKIYGNGVKGVLPQANSEGRPGDLIENSIFASGQSDGSFDQGDFILFYGIGPDRETWTSNGFEYQKNIYSDTSYYFIRIDGENGKRISSKPSLVGTPDTIIQSFNDHLTYEKDENNLISSGRGWFGETLSSGESLSFSHLIEGLKSDVSLTLSAVSQSNENASFDITVNSLPIGTVPIEAVPDGPGTTYSIKARQESQTFSFEAPVEFDLSINFNGNASGERGFVDYYHMTFQRDLKLYDAETPFRWIGNPGEQIRYEVADASNATIWDVTIPTEIREQAFTPSGSKAVFQSQSAGEEFVAFQGDDFPTPFIFGSVPNQNLRGEVNFDAIIIAHPTFVSAGAALAQLHQQHDGLKVKTVTIKQVYNEFSSGRQDVTAIRDYVKHVFENGGKLKYLLLLGDCSYDYKYRVANNTNFVPTYESWESFHPIFSYSSDDYFGFLENDEGIWDETLAGDHTLDIGVGRLPAKSPEEAQAMVEKIIYYTTSANTLGKWRSNITYVADDGDGNIHARHVEDLSELIDTTYAQYNINKLLLDAFVQESSGSSEKSPQARAALKTRIKEGTFAINFIGHGNERLWMEEAIFTTADIEELTNRNKLPIFVTATCEFGRYDDPIRTSGAEQLLLLEQGGAIALLTTSRPVFASTNFSLNQAFHENIFRKEANKHLRLGDVIRLTKNEGLEGPVNRNFTLLGDPMMMPAYPKMDIALDESELDTLSALEEITVKGQIQTNGNLLSSFNGTLSVGIFDTKQAFLTNGQESSPYSYELRSNAIFRGEANVIEGKFSFTFIVPKNISYQFEKGKMSLYAWDTENNQDAGGSSREFVIGGTSSSTIVDDDPPVIIPYINDPTFKNGDVVGDSPLLIADLEDESGITTTNIGVVQGITLALEGQVINLNDFYTAQVDNYKKGTVVYPLQNLEPGRYSATLKVWDTHNNTSEQVIDFTVSDEPILFVYNPAVYPNPVSGSSTFAFEHDREDEDLFISILVYSQRGDIVSKNEVLVENSQRRIEIPWNAKTSGGEALKHGIYYSRLIVKSRLDGAMKEIAQKLVIVN